MKTILDNVNPEHHFKLSDGSAIKNLYELKEKISKINEGMFKHHVREDKNDFHNWVRDVHKDKKLADNLLKIKDKNQLIEHIDKRIREVKGINKTKEIKDIIRKQPKKAIKTTKNKIKTIKKPVKKEVKIRRNLYKKPKTNIRCVHKDFMTCAVREFLIGMGVGIFIGVAVSSFL